MVISSSRPSRGVVHGRNREAFMQVQDKVMCGSFRLVATCEKPMVISSSRPSVHGRNREAFMQVQDKVMCGSFRFVATCEKPMVKFDP